MNYLTPSRDRFLQTLEPLAAGYEPSERIKKSISDRTVTIISGISGVGKDAVIGRTGLHSVQSFTTREPRDNEVTGAGYSRFYDVNRMGDRAQLYLGLGLRHYVQAEAFATGDIYGSRVSDYEPVSILNATARTYAKLAGQGLFRTLRHIHLVSPAAERWLDQLDGRDGIDSAQRADRLRDAEPALLESLGETNTVFIINDDPDIAAEQVARVVTGGTLSGQTLRHGRMAGIAMLDGLRHIMRTGQPSIQVT